MAGKARRRREEDTLSVAIAAGTAEDVRRLLAAGADPNFDGVEEPGDITPLMSAAARGDRDMVRLLVAAGADPDVIAEDHTGGLDRFPFIEDLYRRGALCGMTALAYAAVYGHLEVFDELAPLTAPALRAEGRAVAEAWRAHAESLDAARASGASPTRGARPSARAAAQADLLAARPGLRRWIHECPLCGRRGYKPDLPAEVDRRGGAAALRRHFRPLALDALRLCDRCARKVEAGRRKIQARAARPDGGPGRPG